MRKTFNTIRILILSLVLVSLTSFVSSSYAIFDALSEITNEIIPIGDWSYSTSTPIATAQEFYDFATSSTSNNDDRFYLTNDIDFSGFVWDYNSSFDSNVFKGTFDGKNYTLSNIAISSTDINAVNLSIFSNIEGATIKNVEINNFTLAISSTFHNNASISPSVLTSRISGPGNVITNITIDNASLIANNLDGPGIIASYTNGGCELLLTNIKATNITSMNESKRAGGLIGRIFSTSTSIIIEDVDFQGYIASENRVSNNGAIAGTVQNTLVSISRVIAEYTAEATFNFTDTSRTIKADRYVGGFIGNNNSNQLTITDSFFTGVLYENTNNLGSAVGREKGTTVLNNTYYSDVLFNNSYTASTSTAVVNGILVNASTMPSLSWWNGFALNYFNANDLWAQDPTGRLSLTR